MKTFLISLFVCFVAVGADGGESGGESGGYEVSIPLGRLSGRLETSIEGRSFYAFRKIPYAKPPVGPLRFKDPEPADAWDGVLDATAGPPPCPQFFSIGNTSNGYIDGQEDCLYLNVYTPKPSVSGGLPVMFYIHGGAFVRGQSSWFQPRTFLDHDVVLVVIQYRLGTLGFLSTEDSVIPGNFGLKDQTLALRWVQQNIGFFGGDPNRVTIFGHSAGGSSVHYQMLVPEARGLFAQAILMSGSALCPWAFDTSHKRYALEVAQQVGCPTEDGSTERLLECLQRASPKDLVQMEVSFRTILWNPMVMSPRVDGTYLPERPEILLKKGHFSRVPIMSGISSHEGGLSTQFFYTHENEIDRFLKNFDKFGPESFDMDEGDEYPARIARKIFDHFLGGVVVNLDNADDITQVYGDAMFTIPVDVTSLAHAKLQLPVYMYEVTHRAKRSFLDLKGAGDFAKHWVTHGDDVLVLFNVDFLPVTEPRDRAFQKILVKVYANFAETGNPTPDDSLGFIWEKFESDTLRHVELSLTPTMRDYYRQERRDFWLSLPTERNLLLHPHLVKHFEDEADRAGSTKEEL
ncbi:carboxylic ester hydrolase-like isoform X1 [Oratosquilla oratoria]